MATIAAAAIAIGMTAAAGPACAQRDPQPIDPYRPLIFRFSAEPPAASAHPLTPLDPVQMEVLRDVARARDAGQVELARLRLTSLPAAVARHPIVLTERARTELAARNFAEVVRLAVLERRAQRDSLLLGHELVEACDSLHRVREASLAAAEVWAAAAVEENWAMQTLMRLAPLDAHAGRDAVRRALAREPRRIDLARGLAHLEWAAGDMGVALKTLRATEQAERGPRNRWAFAEVLLQLATTRDSSGASLAYADIAGDTGLDASYRMTAASRAWELAQARGIEAAAAPKIYLALKDIPPGQWMADLSLGIARALRLAGDTGASRTLLGSGAAGGSPPEVMLERWLADLRDGPPERALDALKPGLDASDEQRFHYAEALFFAGQPDSAVDWYKRVAEKPGGARTGAALERLFLIEDGRPRSALPAVGRIAYEQWRNAPKRALALAESLWRTLPPGPLWAYSAMQVARERERGGDARGALAAVLAVADSLPNDRLASLARQRAGDLYSLKLKDETRAIEQYETCVARYPRAWNAPEVRRRLEELRRSRRF